MAAWSDMNARLAFPPRSLPAMVALAIRFELRNLETGLALWAVDPVLDGPVFWGGLVGGILIVDSTRGATACWAVHARPIRHAYLHTQGDLPLSANTHIARSGGGFRRLLRRLLIPILTNVGAMASATIPAAGPSVWI